MKDSNGEITSGKIIDFASYTKDNKTTFYIATQSLNEGKVLGELILRSDVTYGTASVENTIELPIENLTISDLSFVNDKLCVLAYDSSYMNAIRGSLFTIVNDKIESYGYLEVEDTTNFDINAYKNNNFYGPRKFLLVSSEELIFTDYLEHIGDGGEIISESRIVYYNPVNNSFTYKETPNCNF